MSIQRSLILLERLGLLERSGQRERARRMGLPEVQLAILDYLSRCNSYSDTLRDVSEYLGITPGTLSQSLAQLERKGLIRRQRDGRDRRIWHLRLTDRGKELISRERSPLAAILEQWEEKDVQMLERSLQELLTQAQKRHGFKTFSQCATCRHLLTEKAGFRCGLTRKPLHPDQTLQICRDHAFPDAAQPQDEQPGP